MYRVYYFINSYPHRFNFDFAASWVAINKARSIFQILGYASEVMDVSTGEIVAIFDSKKNWIADDAI